MKKDFAVSGKIVIHVSLDVEAQTEEEAIKLAIEDFKSSYNLDVYPRGVEYDGLIASEIEWEDD